MRTTSTIRSATYRTTKTPRLVAIVAVETLGDLASAVFSKPHTIHGCRPTSESTQPASAAAYGSGIAATPSQRNQRLDASVPRRYRNAPSAKIRKTSVPAYAMIRMLQYVVRTGGM